MELCWWFSYSRITLLWVLCYGSFQFLRRHNRSQGVVELKSMSSGENVFCKQKSLQLRLSSINLYDFFGSKARSAVSGTVENKNKLQTLANRLNKIANVHFLPLHDCKSLQFIEKICFGTTSSFFIKEKLKWSEAIVFPSITFNGLMFHNIFSSLFLLRKSRSQNNMFNEQGRSRSRDCRLWPKMTEINGA